MSSVNVFVGLDYSQEFVQMCVMDRSGKVLANRPVANCARTILRAAKRFGVVQAAAVEACCGAADLAEELSSEWSVSLAHPGLVSRMKQSPDKTDFADAKILADLLRVGYLPKVWLAPSRLRQLRRLVRFRQQQVNQRRDAKLRIRALLRENRVRPPQRLSLWTRAGQAWLKHAPLTNEDRWILDQHLETLEQTSKKINETEAMLRGWADDDAVIQKLLTLEGVGLVTAVMLRAEVGRFDRFQTGKQLARFCGVTPRNASSGTRQADAGLIRAGHPQLRATLIELAHRLLCRGSERWAHLAANMLRSGKQKNVVIAAVANRWVRWLFHHMQPENLAA
jgi:transposase